MIELTHATMLRRWRLVLLLGMLSAVSYGQKVGHVNYGRLLERMPAFDQLIKSQESFQDSVGQAFSAKVASHQERVKQLTERYNRGEMTDAEADRINAELSATDQALASEQQQLESLFLERRRQAMSPMIADAKAGIEAYAKANGYQMILDEASGVLLFNRPEDDLTDEIFDFISKQ